MKAQIKITSLMVLSLMSFGVVAETSIAKASTRIDFNRIINDNNHKRTELHKDIDGHAVQAELTEEDAQRGQVVDFVDLEMGWQDNKENPVVETTRPMPDRRYNSVGAARIYNPGEASGT